MAQTRVSLQVAPGKGLGFLLLGASLHDVLARLKSVPDQFPNVEIASSSRGPLTNPIMILLPKNGLRLRFDGQDQRLRLIEVCDFQKSNLSYKGMDLVKPQDDAFLHGHSSRSGMIGPPFRHIYDKLFGPTFPGEYIPPTNKARDLIGTYVLSYPGIAFSFSVKHSAWAGSGDFMAVLSSSAASQAKSLAIYNGPSWKDARQSLFTKASPNLRSQVATARARDSHLDDIELVIVRGLGLVEFCRRNSSSFSLILGETTPQDVVAQLGPPDAIHRKHDRRLSIHKDRRPSRSEHPPFTSSSPAQGSALSDNDHSSISTATDHSSADEESVELNDRSSTECFYNYFRYGFDVFVSTRASSLPGDDVSILTGEQSVAYSSPGGQLVAAKLLLHGNVPGSYVFNRYRRSRWILQMDEGGYQVDPVMSSESCFSHICKILKRTWKVKHGDDISQKGFEPRHMILNRGWDNSPGSSCELLGGSEESMDNTQSGTNATPAVGTTELYGFPGLLFEALKNDSISCLTVY